MKIITRTVLLLSIISLLNDIASELLIPVMPLYLDSIGYSVLFIGVLEGVAGAVAGLTKGYFGNLSDATGKRLPFVGLGYALSAVSKPLMGLFTSPWWIFTAKTTDRLGKGVRTAARDAMLSGETIPQHKGKVFGFHRAMDTIGAVAGPVLAMIYLHYNPGEYRDLFLYAFIPGVFVIFFIFLLKEKKHKRQQGTRTPGFFSFIKYWKKSDTRYRKLVTGLLLFALISSPDVFLLLKMKEAGIDETTVIGAYVFYNIIYAMASYPLGHLGDKLGLKKVFTAGLLIFAIVYIGMSVAESLPVFVILFLLYGVYAASNEGISKAWISNIAREEDTATAIGTYTAFQSLATMIAAALAGFIWSEFGAFYSFSIAGTAALALVIYFYFMKNEVQEKI